MKGLLEQCKETYEYPDKITKEDVKEALMSISTEEFETLWRRTFDESFEDFVDETLNYPPAEYT